MKRVFLYIRVSTEEQAIHGLSIEAQTKACRRGQKLRDIWSSGYIPTLASPPANRPQSVRSFSGC